jgi:hypothetical protein
MHNIPRRNAVIVVTALFTFATVAGGTAFAKKSPAQKCQQQIDKAAAKFTSKKLKKLFKCGNKKLKKSENLQDCLTEEDFKLSKKARKACTADVIRQPASDTALGFTSCATRAPACEVPQDPDSLAACLECSHNFETNCLFGAIFNVFTGPNAACLEGSP